MANLKISQLTGATTPLAGTEVLPIVQSSTTKKVSIADVTAGRAVSAASLALTTSPLPATSGGTGQSSAFVSSGIPYATSTTALTTNSAFQFNGSSAFVTAAVPSLILKETTSGTGHRLETSVTSAGVVKFNLNWDSGLGTRAFSFTQNSVESFNIDSSDNVKINSGNLVIGTSGKGIDFSATAGTGTSELLNDYEEGTWTPVLQSWTIVGTAPAVTGRYTKIGRQVYLYGQIAPVGGTVSYAATAGTSYVDGLPFAVGFNSCGSWSDASNAANVLDTNLVNTGNNIYAPTIAATADVIIFACNYTV